MEAPRLYLLAQLDARANERLAALYEKLLAAGLVGEQTRGIPYHFTLGSFALEHADRVLRRAVAVSAASKAFEIGLSHIGLFGMTVLFIAPSMNIELLSLHDALVPEEPIHGLHKWVAHATLLVDTPERIGAAVPIAARAFAPFAATVESIGVYEFFPKKFIADLPLIR